MNKSAFLVFFLLTAIFIGRAWSLELEEVTLEAVSSTKKSVIIERGELEDFNVGLRARFYLQKGPKEFPKIFLVAEGELIKTFPKKSYWYLKKVEIPEGLKSKSKLFMLISSKVLKGRNLKLRNHHVVIPSGQYNGVDDFIDQNKENVPARLVREEQNYEATPNVFNREEIRDLNPDIDVELTTYETYKERPGSYYSEEYGDLTGQKYYIGNTEVRLGDIKNAEDKKIFDSMNEGYVTKVNGMKYGVKSFYLDQVKMHEDTQVNAVGTMGTVYNGFKEDEKERDKISALALAKFHRDGDQWSSDMDEASLRNYFIETGMEAEVRRRQLVLSEKEGHEFIFHYSGSMVAHGSTHDPNYQGRGYTIGLAYDFHLARVSRDYKKWSIQPEIERGVTEYDLGIFNARSEEFSYGAYLNYYFVNNPQTLNQFMYLAGVGLKYGEASVFTPDISRNYSYQVLSLPVFQVMAKYRFRVGDLREETANVGASWNFGMKYDMKSLSSLDRMDDDIRSKFSINDIRYNLGMSVYF